MVTSSVASAKEEQNPAYRPSDAFIFEPLRSSQLCLASLPSQRRRRVATATSPLCAARKGEAGLGLLRVGPRTRPSSSTKLLQSERVVFPAKVFFQQVAKEGFIRRRLREQRQTRTEFEIVGRAEDPMSALTFDRQNRLATFAQA